MSSKILLTFILLTPIINLGLSQTGSIQSKVISEPEPFFWAIIVNNMDSSIEWYRENLDLELLYNNTYEEHGFRQAALQNEFLLIELLQTDSNIRPSEILAEKPGNVRLAGIFKVGFRVNDFDAWYERAQRNGVEFLGNVVDDPVSGMRMIILLDPDGNRIQLFEK